jgi:hypothetical protein
LEKQSRGDRPNDEPSGLLGGHEPGAPDTWRFSIDVARMGIGLRRSAGAIDPQGRSAIGDDP